MITSIRKQQAHPIYRFISGLVAFTFVFSSVMPPTASYAQVVPATVLNLPAPGTMVPLSSGFTPAMVDGITIHPNDPFKFDFLVGRGDNNLQGEEFQAEAKKLIKYFLASLTVPEEELWVNLSPYEKDRIIPESLAKTEMGRDLLAQDYMLKQLTASLMYPENELGQKFWNRIRSKVQKEYGNSNLPVDTFNKVWIVPENASVYETENTAIVIDSYLKVMLESDYVAMKSQQDFTATSRASARDMALEHSKTGDISLGEKSQSSVVSRQSSEGDLKTEDRRLKADNESSQEIIREIIIPAIEKEINEGETFANLRQVYNSMILATWYKKNMRESLLGQVYVDQNKVSGIDTVGTDMKDKIYEQYLKAFNIGVYNYIREEYDVNAQEIVPRKYFAGGMSPVTSVSSSPVGDRGAIKVALDRTRRDVAFSVRLASSSPVESVENRVRQIIVNWLNIQSEDVTPEASLIDDLGTDSLDITEIIMALEEEFDIDISDEEEQRIDSLSDAVKVIEVARTASSPMKTKLPNDILIKALRIILSKGSESFSNNKIFNEVFGNSGAIDPRISELRVLLSDLGEQGILVRTETEPPLGHWNLVEDKKGELETLITQTQEAAASSPVESVENRVRQIIVNWLNIQSEDVTPEASLIDDLGTDSLDITEIIMALEEEFDIDISDEVADKIDSLRSAVEEVEKLMAASSPLEAAKFVTKAANNPAPKNVGLVEQLGSILGQLKSDGKITNTNGWDRERLFEEAVRGENTRYEDFIERLRTSEKLDKAQKGKEEFERIKAERENRAPQPVASIKEAKIRNFKLLHKHGFKTQVGAAGFVTEFDSRYGDGTFDREDEFHVVDNLGSQKSASRHKDAPDEDRIISAVLDHLKDKELLQLDLTLGEDPAEAPHGRLLIDSNYGRNAMMARGLFALREGVEDETSDITVITLPDLNLKELGITTDGRAHILRIESLRLQLVLGTDYFGENKKAFLTQLGGFEKARGNIPLHAGSFITRAKNKLGKWVKKMWLAAGLSGTGKTSTVAQDHGLNQEGEHAYMLQDDFNIAVPEREGDPVTGKIVGIKKVRGTEKNGSYVKSEDVTAKKEPRIYRGLMEDPESILENVAMKEVDGKLVPQLLDYDMTNNGRAILTRRAMVGDEFANESIDMDGIDIFMMLSRGGLVPAATIWDPARGSGMFGEGETWVTSAADPDPRKWGAKRIHAFTVFSMAPQGMDIEVMRQIAETSDMRWLSTNTGAVGYQEDDKGNVIEPGQDVSLKMSGNVIRALAKDEATFEYHEKIRGEVISGGVTDLEGNVVDMSPYSPDQYYGDGFDNAINELEKARRAQLKELDAAFNEYKIHPSVFEAFPGASSSPIQPEDKQISSPAQSREKIEERVIKVTAVYLDVEPAQVTLEASFFEYLGSTIDDLTRLIMAFEDEFDLEISDKEIEELVNLNTVVYLIEAKQSVQDRVRGIITEKLRRLNVDSDDVTPGALFVNDLGANSLDILNIILQIEREFDIAISYKEIENIDSLQRAVETINLLTAASSPIQPEGRQASSPLIAVGSEPSSYGPHPSQEGLRALYERISWARKHAPDALRIKDIVAIKDQKHGAGPKPAITFSVILENDIHINQNAPVMGGISAGVNEPGTHASIDEAIAFFNKNVRQRLIGLNISQPKQITEKLIEIDDEFRAQAENKEKPRFSYIGSEISVGVSMIGTIALAEALNVPTPVVINYRYNEYVLTHNLATELRPMSIPVNYSVVWEGGKHGVAKYLDELVEEGIIQDASRFPERFTDAGLKAKKDKSILLAMVPPQETQVMVLSPTWQEAFDIGVELTNAYENLLKEKGIKTKYGAESGFTTEQMRTADGDLITQELALEILDQAVDSLDPEKAKYVRYALDIAASEMYIPEIDMYYIGPDAAARIPGISEQSKKDGLVSNEEFTQYKLGLFEKHSRFISVEDWADENRPDHWESAKQIMNHMIQMGDDFDVSLAYWIQKYDEYQNAHLQKPNQSGEEEVAIEAVGTSHHLGNVVVASHRGTRSAQETYTALFAIGAGVFGGKWTLWGPGRGALIAAMSQMDAILNQSTGEDVNLFYQGAFVLDPDGSYKDVGWARRVRREIATASSPIQPEGRQASSPLIMYADNEGIFRGIIERQLGEKANRAGYTVDLVQRRHASRADLEAIKAEIEQQLGIKLLYADHKKLGQIGKRSKKAFLEVIGDRLHNSFDANNFVLLIVSNVNHKIVRKVLDIIRRALDVPKDRINDLGQDISKDLKATPEQITQIARMIKDEFDIESFPRSIVAQNKTVRELIEAVNTAAWPYHSISSPVPMTASQVKGRLESIARILETELFSRGRRNNAEDRKHLGPLRAKVRIMERAISRFSLIDSEVNSSLISLIGQLERRRDADDLVKQIRRISIEFNGGAASSPVPEGDEASLSVTDEDQRLAREAMSDKTMDPNRSLAEYSDALRRVEDGKVSAWAWLKRFNWEFASRSSIEELETRALELEQRAASSPVSFEIKQIVFSTIENTFALDPRSVGMSYSFEDRGTSSGDMTLLIHNLNINLEEENITIPQREEWGFIKTAEDLVEEIGRVIERASSSPVQPEDGKASSPLSQEVGDSAEVGGIDLDSEHLNLKVERDGNGIPLPVSMQPVELININGLVPVIINVAPVSMPLIFGANYNKNDVPLADTETDKSLDSARNEFFDKLNIDEEIEAI